MISEFQIANERLGDLIRMGVEEHVLVRDIGLSGLLHNVQFTTSLVDLLSHRALPNTVAIDHIRVTQVALFHDPAPRDVPISVPPQITLTGDFLPPPASIISVPQLGASVTLDVHLVRQHDMAAADGNPVAPDDTMVVQCRANCTIAPLTLDGGILAINATTVDVELGFFGIFARLPPAEERMGLNLTELLVLFRRHNPWSSPLTNPEAAGLLNFLLQINDPAVRSRINVPPIPLNVSGVARMLDSLPGSAGPLKIWNVGLSGDSRRVIVRLQLEPRAAIDLLLFAFRGGLASAWMADWTAFYNGASTPRLGAQDWSMFFPSEIVIDNLHTSIVNAAATDARFEMSAGGEPRSEWRVDGGTLDPNSPCSAGSRVQLITRFALFFPGRCLPLGLGIDVNIRLTTVLSLRPDNVLRAEVHVDFTPDEGDALTCAFLNSIFSGGIDSFLPLSPILTPTLTNLAAGFISFIAIFAYDPGPIDLGSRLIPVPGSNRDFVLDIPLGTDLSLRNGEIRISELVACPDGFCVRGSVITREMELLLAGELSDRGPFGWSTLGLCTDEDPWMEALARLRWRLETTRPGFGQMPVHLFRFQILDAAPVALQTFMPEVTLEHGPGMVLKASTDEDTALELTRATVEAGVDASFLEMFIQTNVGSRVVRLRAFDGTLTPDNHASFVETRHRLCAFLENFRRARREPGRFASFIDFSPITRELTVRPREGARVMSLWTAMASELNGGDSLQVGRAGGLQGIELIHEYPAANKVALARVAEYVHKTDSRLLLGLKNHSSNEGSLVVVWKYFHEQARIPFAGKWRDLAIERVDGERYLALLADGGLDIYNLTGPEPRPVFSSVLAEMTSLSWQRGMLVIEGQRNAYYHPQVNRLLAKPLFPLPQGKPRTVKRFQVLDEQGKWLTFEPFEKLAIVMDDQSPYGSVFECVDLKQADPLPS